MIVVAEATCVHEPPGAAASVPHHGPPLDLLDPPGLGARPPSRKASPPPSEQWR